MEPHSCRNKEGSGAVGFLLWLALVASLSGHRASGQGQPSLRGTVVNGMGAPVERAKVEILPERGGRALIPDIYTSREGKFEATGFAPGRYQVYAYKNEEGYGNPSYSIYSLVSPPIQYVEITESRTAEVVINLGSPLGRLSCDVVNADTGKPEKSRFRLTIVDQPDLWLSSNTDGNGHFTIPAPSAPIELEVEAPGFTTWRAGRLVIPKGVVKALTIRLKQIESANR